MNDRFFLVEFMPSGRCIYYAGDDFPYVQGFLKSIGVPVQWIYLACTAECFADPYVVDPPPADVAALLEAAERFRPTAIVINQACSEGFLAAIRMRFPGARVVLCSMSSSTPGILQSGGLDEQVGAKASHLTDIVPDFTSTNLLGTEVTGLRPIEFQPFRNRCLYRRPIAQNRVFEGVDLARAHEQVGCSFCLGFGRSAPTPPGGTPSAEQDLWRTFLCRFAETAPLERQRATFKMGDAQLFPAALRTTLDAPLAPSTFIYLRRVDEILAAEPILRACLPIYQERGHKIVFDCVGVENFSPRELARFNKGTSVEDIERFFRVMTELESAWPEALVFFRGTGEPDEALGFMFIMFTPWTTIEDVTINLDTIVRLSETVAPPLRLMRHQLASRLKLLPGAAITLLAERDGLLASEFPDPVAEHSAGADGRAMEVPWRFAHADVALLHRFVVWLLGKPMIPASHPTTSDAGVRRIMHEIARTARAHGIATARLFRMLVDVVREFPGDALADEAVLDRFQARLLERGFLPPPRRPSPHR